MYIIPSHEEQVAKIALGPWKSNGELRRKLNENFDEYLKLVGQALTQAVDEIVQRPRK